MWHECPAEGCDKRTLRPGPCSKACRKSVEAARRSANAHAIEVLVQQTRGASARQEAAIAQDTGGRVVRASGALPGRKGDIRTGDRLIEAKTTRKNSYSLSADTILKISAEARAVDRKWALVVSIGGVQVAIIDYAELTEAP